MSRSARTIEDIRRELETVLDRIREGDYEALSKSQARNWLDILDDSFADTGMGDRWNSCVDEIVQRLPDDLSEEEKDNDAADIIQIIYTMGPR